MEEILSKIESFKNNCYEMARNQADTLKKEIDKEINESIKTEVNRYKEEKERNFNKRVQKLERMYNSEIYNQETEIKQNIASKNKELNSNLKSEIYEKIKQFTDTEDYKNFLFKNIEEVLRNCNSDCTTLYLTKKDYDKYKFEIEKQFLCNIELMEDSNLGGSMGKTKGIFVDNSLRTLTKEKINLSLLGENDE